MRTFRFNKLVRDKLIDQQKQSGGRPNYQVLSDREYLETLIKLCSTPTYSPQEACL